MAEHPFAVTHDRYDEAMALARRMARERDERFEQLQNAEAERNRYARALIKIASGPNADPYSEPWSRAEALIALNQPGSDEHGKREP